MEEISRGGPLRGEFPVYVNFRVVVGGEKQAGFLGEFVEEEFPPLKSVWRFCSAFDFSRTLFPLSKSYCR